MFTKEQILSQLNSLQVSSGRPVIIHTSMRAVGEVEGGAKTLLDALIERFTCNDGLLIVPTHTWANFEDEKDIILDKTALTTCTGALSNVALNDKRSVRSLNPTHSVAVFGNKKEQFARLDDNVNTPCSPSGCYGKIIDSDGYVLLIGVGQEKNTLLHCVEEILDIPCRLSLSPVKMAIRELDGTITYRDFHFMTEEKGDVSLNFPKYERAFRYHGAITDGKIGNALVQVCSASKMASAMKLICLRSGKKELLSDSLPLDISLYE